MDRSQSARDGGHESIPAFARGKEPHQRHVAKGRRRPSDCQPACTIDGLAPRVNSSRPGWPARGCGPPTTPKRLTTSHSQWPHRPGPSSSSAASRPPNTTSCDSGRGIQPIADDERQPRRPTKSGSRRIGRPALRIRPRATAAGPNSSICDIQTSGQRGAGVKNVVHQQHLAVANVAGEQVEVDDQRPRPGPFLAMIAGLDPTRPAKACPAADQVGQEDHAAD